MTSEIIGFWRPRLRTAGPLLLIGALVLGACQTTNSTAPQGDIHINARVAGALMGWFENEQPGTFGITEDGKRSYGTYCPRAMQCLPGRDKMKRFCRTKMKKECVILAELGQIRWNGRVTAPRPKTRSVVGQIQFRGSTGGSYRSITGYIPISDDGIVERDFPYNNKDCHIRSDLKDKKWTVDCGPTLTINGTITQDDDLYYGFGKGSNGETFKIRMAPPSYLEKKGVEFVGRTRSDTKTPRTNTETYGEHEARPFKVLTAESLCRVAVVQIYGEPAAWTEDDWMKGYVKEVNTRGYSLDDCLRHIRRTG